MSKKIKADIVLEYIRYYSLSYSCIRYIFFCMMSEFEYR